MANLTPEGLADIKAKAEAATPGPYSIDPDPQWAGRIVRNPDGRIVFDCSIWEHGDNSQEDAAYIAALSPDVALALVAEVERLSALWVSLEEALALLDGKGADDAD